MMLSHALASLKKVRVLALAGLALPLPLIAFSVYVFDHYLKYWYRDPFVLGILGVFLLGQFMAVRENISLLGGLGKCRRLLQWLQNQAQLDADGLLGGLQALPSGHLRDVVEARNSQMREALAAFKLEVGKSYASIADMRELEGRLVGHLLRIEAKLDTTAMKTEALHARDGIHG